MVILVSFFTIIHYLQLYQPTIRMGDNSTRGLPIAQEFNMCTITTFSRIYSYETTVPRGEVTFLLLMSTFFINIALQWHNKNL